MCLSSSSHRRELFQKTNGARENAAKILVVITDGEKYGDPLDYKDVIPEADRAGVIRYVIGVGNTDIGLGTSVETGDFLLMCSVFSLQILVKLKGDKDHCQAVHLATTDLCHNNAGYVTNDSRSSGFISQLVVCQVVFLVSARLTYISAISCRLGQIC